MKLLGLTGGIATGKSTVAEMLKRKGAFIIDADQLAREVVQPGEASFDKVVAHFGKEILSDQGDIDRERLAAIIRKDPKAREALNTITHPVIIQRMNQMVQDNAHYPFIFLETPLMIETGFYKQVDKLVLVYAPKKIQIQRLMQRQGMTTEQAQEWLATQLPIDDKRKYADYVIDNSGDLAVTQAHVEQMWKDIQSS